MARRWARTVRPNLQHSLAPPDAKRKTEGGGDRLGGLRWAVGRRRLRRGRLGGVPRRAQLGVDAGEAEAMAGRSRGEGWRGRRRKWSYWVDFGRSDCKRHLGWGTSRKPVVLRKCWGRKRRNERKVRMESFRSDRKRLLKAGYPCTVCFNRNQRNSKNNSFQPSQNEDSIDYTRLDFKLNSILLRTVPTKHSSNWNIQEVIKKRRE